MEFTIEQALHKGIVAQKAGQIQEADKYYSAILKVQPKQSDANHNMGVWLLGLEEHKKPYYFSKQL